MSGNDVKPLGGEPGAIDPFQEHAGWGLRLLRALGWFLLGLAWLVIVLLYTGVVLGYFWPQDYASTSTLRVALAGIGYAIRFFIWQWGLVLLAVVLGLALARAARTALAAVPLLAVALGPGLLMYIPRSSGSAIGPEATVMAANVLVGNTQYQAVLQTIEAVSPDILLLEEYHQDWRRAIHGDLAALYPYVEWLDDKGIPGSAIYSRLPLQEDSAVRGLHLAHYRTVVSVGGRDIALYSIHMAAPLGWDRYVRSRLQMVDLIDIVRSETLPILMAGDFNFAERTPKAAALRRLGMGDANMLAGWGRGATWPAKGWTRYLPGVRIDHIYLREDLVCTQSGTVLVPGSDHRAVVARVGWRR